MIYFDNPFRTLGLLPDVTRVGARTAMQSLRARSRMAASDAPNDSSNDPLCSLAVVNRGEEAVRDAFNALGAVGARLEARLLWFTESDERDAHALRCLAAGDFRGAIDAWSATDEVGACANLARLYHALAIATDLYAVAASRAVKDPWREAVRLWLRVAADERFWRDLALADAAGGFEPAAQGEDIAALRRNLWSLLVAPSAALIDRLVVKRDYAAARDHINALQTGGMPPAQIAALEIEGFAPFFSKLDTALDDARIALPRRVGTGMRGSVGARYAAYRKLAVPLLVDLLERTGKDFEPTKRARRRCAEFLEVLVADAVHAGAHQVALRLGKEWKALLGGTITKQLRLTETGAIRTPYLAYVGLALVVLGLSGKVAMDEDSKRSRNALIERYADRNEHPVTRFGDVHDSDLNAIARSMDSARGLLDSLVPVASADAEIDRQCASVSAFSMQLEKTLAGLDRLDSLERTIDRNDTLRRRLTMERARQAWRARIEDQWGKLDDRYRNCARLLEDRNRKVAGNRRQAEAWNLKRRELPKEMIATHDRLARTMRRLSAARSG